MAKKRTKLNGEGTLYTEQRNGKTYYRAMVSIGKDKNGTIIRKTVGGYDKDDVLKKKQEIEYKNNIGMISIDENITLEKWFETWLFDFRINDLKASSFERYEGILRNYIEGSSIGRLKLSGLKTSHFQKYFNNLKSNGTSYSTIATIKKFLNCCMNGAVEHEYIVKNYCSAVKLPKQEKIDKDTDIDDIDFFTKEEQEKFLLSIIGHPYELAFKLSLGTGLRLGELIALKWTDIDFINNTINVNKALKTVTMIDRERNRNLKLIEQSPKTESSYRTVPVPSNIMSELKSHLKDQDRIKKDNEFYTDLDYVFTDRVGKPYDPKKLPRNFKSVLKKMGHRDMKYHSMRHSYATRLFEANIPVKTVQKLLGHKDITTTMNIYTHVANELKSEAAESINELFRVVK